MRRWLPWAALLTLGCAGSTREPVAPKDPMTLAEIAIGNATHLLSAELPEEYGDAKLDRYVNEVGQRVARHSPRASLPWTFQVLDSPEADARVHPGGRVVITRGALSLLESEAELAGIFAHEVAHVSFHHSDSAWRPDFPVTGGEDARRRSELRDADHERQADALALRYLTAAGYDSRALAAALAALERTRPPHGNGDSHPSPDARASRLAVLARLNPGEWGRERYLAHMNGLAVGPGRHAPRLVGRRWVVPGALALHVPPELVPVSNGSLLEAKSADGEDALLVFAFTRPSVWSRAFKDGIRSLPHTVSEVAGRPVFSLAPSQSGRGVALVDRGDTLLLLVASEDVRARVLASAMPAHADTKTRRISIQRAKRRMTLDAFLDAECPDTSNLEAERLNGIHRAATIRAGSLVKCVANSIAVERR